MKNKIEFIYFKYKSLWSLFGTDAEFLNRIDNIYISFKKLEKLISIFAKVNITITKMITENSYLDIGMLPSELQIGPLVQKNSKNYGIFIQRREKQ